MALFGKKKTQEKKENAGTPRAGSVRVVADIHRDLNAVIIRPRITEKAVGLTNNNVYTFVVHQNATKYDVRDAVRALFSVTPVKVRIVKRTPRVRHSRLRGRTMRVAGQKKAYVYLKKGDHIDLV